jgi:TonB family protein
LLGFLLLTQRPAHGVHQRIVQRWTTQLVTTSLLLKNGDYERALPILQKLITEESEVLGPGDAAAEVLGIPLVQQAIAEVGLGRVKDGLWHWYVAISLYPALRNSDLSMFGKPAEVLKAAPLPETENVKSPADLAITPPKVVVRPEPRYPSGARAFGVKGVLIVKAIITKGGEPRSPQIIQALPGPTLSYSALEALRNWRFTPASVNGEPIEMSFKLTINFKL